MGFFKSFCVAAKQRLRSKKGPGASGPDPADKNVARSVVEPVNISEPFELGKPQSRPQSPISTEPTRRSLSHIPVVDEEIPINITVNYNDEPLERIVDFRTRWMDPSLLDVLENAVLSCLKKCDVVADAQLLHRESGVCKLIRQADQKIMSTTIWKSEQQWREEIPVMIMRFGASQAKVSFYLNIVWEYVDPRIPEVPGEPYVTTVHKAIARKMTKNFKDIDYISRANLKIILSKSTISLLVDRDASLQFPASPLERSDEKEVKFDRDSFIEDIWTDGIRLLALHVCTNTPLVCLLEMMAGGMLDANLVKKPLTEKDCPCDSYNHTFKNLVMLQDRFVLHDFPKPGRSPTHHDLHAKIGMPIKIHEEIGSGSFGTVYKVSIEKEHHEFPCDDPNGYFAMKEFHNGGQRTVDDFNRESKMLQMLAEFPHKHITPYLASWTFQGTFYMLFPLATSNLRTFLDQKSQNEMDQPFMTWLISQLAGLADGVRKIHNIGGRAAPTALGRFQQQVSGKSRTGFHHDLRPENILLFAEDGSNYPTLRISDFGSASFRQLPSGALAGSRRSYHTRGAFDGDPTYGAPETDTDDGTSRPYDIWSLGCIFLEIILWVFRKDLKDFTFERLKISQDHTLKSQNLAFWFKTSKGERKLKPAVAHHLTQLVARCAGRGSFESLVSIIRRMLSLHPADRITAAELWNALDAMKLSIAIELGQNSRAYMEQKGHTIFAGPPSNVIERLTTIDDTPSPAQLTPSGLGHWRTISDGKQVRKLERSSYSDLRHLRPLDTDVSFVPARSRSPSIAISHVDNPASVIDGMDELDVINYGPPVGSHSIPWGLEDLVNGRPHSARSKRSLSDGDKPLGQTTFGS